MKRKHTIAVMILVAALIIVALSAAIFISDKMATEQFLNDFNVMNGHYKQALYQTGQGNRDMARKEYDAFISTLSDFRSKYETSRPKRLRDDTAFNDDLGNTQNIAAQASDNIKDGNLSKAHTTLEGIRPIFNEVLRRNDLSLLSVALVDFHDSMERVMEAGDAQNSALVLELYVDADNKLKTVESELNDTDVQAIRVQLDTMRNLAAKGDMTKLPEQAGKLKASYVKVYLQQG